VVQAIRLSAQAQRRRGAAVQKMQGGVMKSKIRDMVYGHRLTATYQLSPEDIESVISILRDQELRIKKLVKEFESLKNKTVF